MSKKLYTFNDLSKKYNKDLSYISKMAKEFKLKVTKINSNKHPCQAISVSEIAKLERKNPSLSLSLIGRNEHEVNAIAKERKQDVSNFLKFLKTKGFSLEKRLRKEGGRPCNVLTTKEYSRLQKEFPTK